MSDLEYSKIRPTETGRYWMELAGIQKIVKTFKDVATGELYIEDNSNPFKPTIAFVNNMNARWSQKL